MNRRTFLTALIGTALAAKVLPAADAGIPVLRSYGSGGGHLLLNGSPRHYEYCLYCNPEMLRTLRAGDPISLCARHERRYLPNTTISPRDLEIPYTKI